MGDDQRGVVGREFGQGLIDRLLGLGVQLGIQRQYTLIGFFQFGLLFSRALVARRAEFSRGTRTQYARPRSRTRC